MVKAKHQWATRFITFVWTFGLLTFMLAARTGAASRDLAADESDESHRC